MTIPTENNISVKECNKISRYKDLEIEIEHIWHLKTTTMPVIVGTLGMIKKGADKYINKIPSRPSQCELQKIAFSRTGYLPWRRISMWLKNITQKEAAKIDKIHIIPIFPQARSWLKIRWRIIRNWNWNWKLNNNKNNNNWDNCHFHVPKNCGTWKWRLYQL